MRASIILTVAICVALAVPSAFAQPYEAPVAFSGAVVGKRPVADALVFIFNGKYGPAPSLERYWRVPDAIGRTDADGRFRIEVPPGTFYAMIVAKPTNSRPGPPSDGEVIYFAPDAAGNPVSYFAGAGTEVDAGTITHDVTFRKDMARREGKNITAVSGRVVGSDGKPVAGAVVFASTGDDSGAKPVFVSDLTGVDGKYVLRFNEGGAYYLRAEDIVGGAAAVSGDGRRIKPVTVKIKTEEKLLDIDVKMNTGVPASAFRWPFGRD